MKAAIKPNRLIGRTAWLWSRIRQKIWFRSALFSLAAIAIAAFSAFAGKFIPYDPSLTLASGSVDSILNVIATSMLAVTTFSLSIMVAAYSSATSNVTPRSTKVLLSDPVAQNTLSTFLGSFLFAIVGIIGLSAGIYDDAGRVILFFATLVVLAIITITLLKWIDQLGRFGRVGDTIDRIERVTVPAFVSAAETPGLGTLPIDDRLRPAVPIFLDDVGCVTHIDIQRIDRIAEEMDGEIHLAVLPGSLVDPSRAVLHVGESFDEEARQRLAECISTSRAREFDQDPRFGLVVLSEIASRAMSPAINDPGTAIDVLGSVLRVLLAYSEAAKQREEPACSRVYGPRLDPLDLLAIVVNPLARDAAGNLEVLTRALRILSALRSADARLYAAPARLCAQRLLESALQDDAPQWERDRLMAIAARYDFHPVAA